MVFKKIENNYSEAVCDFKNVVIKNTVHSIKAILKSIIDYFVSISVVTAFEKYQNLVAPLVVEKVKN